MMNIEQKSKVDHTTGFKLLTKFQNQWQRLHSNSERNVNKAQAALQKLNILEKSTVRQLNALETFLLSYKSISKLDDQLQDIESDLTSLESSFHRIEDLLIVLKNHKENVDTDEYVENMKADYKLQVKEMRRNQDVRKEQLKLEHLKRVEELEREQLAETELRRHLYEKAFEEEKNRFLEKKSKTPQ